MENSEKKETVANETEVKPENEVNPSAAVDALLSENEPKPAESPDKTVTSEAKPSAPVVPPEPVVSATEKKQDASATPAPATPPAETAPDTQAKKYADRFESTFDLIDGVLEEVKALGKDKKEISALVTEAQKSGDWSKVESKYKEYQSDYNKKVEETKAKEKPVETTADTVQEPDMELGEYQAVLVETTMKQISDSDVARKFAKFDVKLPQTQEELDALEIAHPNLWMQYTDAFKRLYMANDENARGFLEADRTQSTHNETQLQQTKSQIEAFAKKYGTTVDPSEVERILTEAQKLDTVYENRHGVKFLRENSLYKYFLAEAAEKIIENVRKATEAEALNRGRAEAAKTIHSNNEAAPKTISTSQVPPTQSTAPKDPDWNNPDEARKVGSEKIASKIDELLYS